MKSFKTIKSAIKSLDELYGRDHWTSVGFVDQILICDIWTTVSYGLRMDPSTDKEYRYFRNLEHDMKYSFASIRLS